MNYLLSQQASPGTLLSHHLPFCSGLSVLSSEFAASGFHYEIYDSGGNTSSAYPKILHPVWESRSYKFTTKKCLCSDQPYQLAISYNNRTPWVSCELWEVGLLPAHPKNDQFIWDLGLFEVGLVCVPLQKQFRSVSRNTLPFLLTISTARKCCCHGGVYIAWYVTKEKLCIILTVHSHNGQGSFYIIVDQCVLDTIIFCAVWGEELQDTFKQG